MVQNIFEEGIFKLRELGVDDVVVPFILIFAVVYAIFSKIKIWGENKEKKYQGAKFDVVIALVVSLLAVWQHMANPGSQWDIVEMLNKALPQVSLVLVAAVMMILMIGIVAGEAPTVSGATKVMAYIVQFGAVAALVYIFGSSAGLSYWDLPYWLVSYDIWVLIVVLLVFGLILRYITGTEDKKKTKLQYMDKDGKLKDGPEIDDKFNEKLKAHLGSLYKDGKK